MESISRCKQNGRFPNPFIDGINPTQSIRNAHILCENRGSGDLQRSARISESRKQRTRTNPTEKASPHIAPTRSRTHLSCYATNSSRERRQLRASHADNYEPRTTPAPRRLYASGAVPGNTQSAISVNTQRTCHTSGHEPGESSGAMPTGVGNSVRKAKALAHRERDPGSGVPVSVASSLAGKAGAQLPAKKTDVESAQDDAYDYPVSA
jgi:hypothetical protein